VIGLADRWHKLPEEILAMDAAGIRYLDILARSKGEGANDAERDHYPGESYQ